MSLKVGVFPLVMCSHQCQMEQEPMTAAKSFYMELYADSLLSLTSLVLEAFIEFRLA